MPFFETLLYKLRYNPPPRLLINGLKRVGITVLPYYLVRRSVKAKPDRNRAGARLVELHAADMARIAAMPMANSDERAFLSRLQQGRRCIGLMLDHELVSYCWLAIGACQVNGEHLELASDEAYAFDIYTLPRRRGEGLAPLLNALLGELLHASGIRTVVSVVDYYNRPSLRYLEKVGARRQRLNLYVRLFGLVEKSFVLKSFPSALAS